ncbi:MAG: GTP-binding protein [Planctomycetes bacterium]|nr:GTP-binding protein [Planctomycetota bacterium]
MPNATSSPAAATPLHVLTGFLGSGKTTLLQRVLAKTTERVAVLVNEIAQLPIDERLLAGYDEDVLALPGGCVCCALRDDLHEALARLRAFAPDRIVLETSGLADPAPLLGALTDDARFAAAVRLAGVIAVVDCERLEVLLDSEPEARRQLDLCDRVVVAKADLAPHRLDAVRERMAASAPGRDVRVFGDGDPDLRWLFAEPTFDGAAGGWLHAPTDHGAATAHCLRSEAPVDVEALQLWLRLAAQLDGPRLLRFKAVARCARTGSAFALQSAGRSVSPPLRLAAAPRDVTGAEVVLIERGLPPRALQQTMAALRQALATAGAR